MTMNFEYDKEVDAAYIYLQYPMKDGQTKTSVELSDNMVLDFDTEGKLLGVEMLNASNVLQKKTLMEAQPA